MKRSGCATTVAMVMALALTPATASAAVGHDRPGSVRPWIAYQTSYNGYRLDPWAPHNAHSQQTSSLNGWHTVVTQVSGGHVTYYIDGELLGDHTVDEQTGQYPVAPRVPMTVNFNLWFIDTAGHKGGRSTYTEDVDWFYYAKDQVIAPDEVTATATSLRSAGTTHLDTVDSGSCGGSTSTSTTVASH